MTNTPTMGLPQPDTNSDVIETIAALKAGFSVIDGLFPIGTIYQSTRNVNPHEFIGGTWTPLVGRMLVGAGTDFPAGTTGGEKEHTLTVGEMPSHNHTQGRWGFVVSEGGNTGQFGAPAGQSYAENTGVDAGGGQPHNNMPPYRAVYMWERTA